MKKRELRSLDTSLSGRLNLACESFIDTLNTAGSFPPFMSRDDAVLTENCGDTKLVSRFCRVDLSALLTDPGDGKLFYLRPKHKNRMEEPY